MKYFIANWKARITADQALNWSKDFGDKISADTVLQTELNNDKIRIVICAPYPFLLLLRNQFNNHKNILLGSQDISPFDEGAYTGEVTAKMLQGTIHYSIIGHSERRHFFHEIEETIGRKIGQACSHGIEPILCIRGPKDKIHPAVKIIAYEPVEAVGTGNNENLQQVIEMKKKLKLAANTVFIYGGSVDPADINSYTATGEIDGFLIGNASLDPIEFYQTIVNSQS